MNEFFSTSHEIMCARMWTESCYVLRNKVQYWDFKTHVEFYVGKKCMLGVIHGGVTKVIKIKVFIGINVKNVKDKTKFCLKIWNLNTGSKQHKIENVKKKKKYKIIVKLNHSNTTEGKSNVYF